MNFYKFCKLGKLFKERYWMLIEFPIRGDWSKSNYAYEKCSEVDKFSAKFKFTEILNVSNFPSNTYRKVMSAILGNILKKKVLLAAKLKVYDRKKERKQYFLQSTKETKSKACI